VPAPYSLPASPHRLLNDATLRIGENPDGVSWNFESISQI
jgi:ubiquinol-cytochrome c reductase iron-sulfur subunit